MSSEAACDDVDGVTDDDLELDGVEVDASVFVALTGVDFHQLLLPLVLLSDLIRAGEFASELFLSIKVLLRGVAGSEFFLPTISVLCFGVITVFKHVFDVFWSGFASCLEWGCESTKSCPSKTGLVGDTVSSTLLFFLADLPPDFDFFADDTESG